MLPVLIYVDFVVIFESVNKEIASWTHVQSSNKSVPVPVFIVGGRQLLISTLAANIVSFIHKTGIVPLSKVMQLLVDMVTSGAPVSNTSAHADCTDASGQTLVSLCRSMVPENFIKSLLDEIHSEMVISQIFCYELLHSIDLVAFKC